MGEKKSYREWSQKILGFGKKKPAEKPAAQPAAPPTAPPQPAVSKVILVIDDSEIDRMILEEVLTQAGYPVILAVDGEDGVKRFREHLPALTITDMIMPGKSGTEVIMELLNDFPDARFIAMSSGGELGP